MVTLLAASGTGFPAAHTATRVAINMEQPTAEAVEVQTQNGVVCVRITRADIVDVAVANRIFDRIRNAIAGQDTPRLMINLDGVRFVCSSVIAGLCAVFREVVTKRSGKLAICCVSPELLDTLRLMRLDMLLPLFETEHDSMTAIGA